MKQNEQLTCLRFPVKTTFWNDSFLSMRKCFLAGTYHFNIILYDPEKISNIILKGTVFNCQILLGKSKLSSLPSQPSYLVSFSRKPEWVKYQTGGGLYATIFVSFRAPPTISTRRHHHRHHHYRLRHRHHLQHHIDHDFLSLMLRISFHFLWTR